MQTYNENIVQGTLLPDLSFAIEGIPEKKIPFLAIFDRIDSIVVPFDTNIFAVYIISSNAFYYIDEDMNFTKIVTKNYDFAKQTILSKIVDLGTVKTLIELYAKRSEIEFPNIYGLHVTENNNFYVFSSRFPITQLKI